MKKLFLQITVNFIFGIFIFNSIFTSVKAVGGVERIDDPIGTDLEGLVSDLSQIIRPVILISFLGVMLYGGYTKMTAGADPDKDARSTKIITAGIIGFIIIALSYVIVDVVQQLLGVV